MSKSRPLAYDRVNLFGPTKINLIGSGDAKIFYLNDDDTKFMPTSIVLENETTSGVTTVEPEIEIDNGITGQTVGTSLLYTAGLAAEGYYNEVPLTPNPVPVITGKTIAITNVARSANVATVTTASSHGFTAGDIVTVEGAGDFNAERVTILATPLATTFTYINVGKNIAPTPETSAQVVYGDVIRIKKATVGVGGERTINAYVVGVYW